MAQLVDEGPGLLPVGAGATGPLAEADDEVLVAHTAAARRGVAGRLVVDEEGVVEVGAAARGEVGEADQGQRLEGHDLGLFDDVARRVAVDDHVDPGGLAGEAGAGVRAGGARHRRGRRPVEHADDLVHGAVGGPVAVGGERAVHVVDLDCDRLAAGVGAHRVQGGEDAVGVVPEALELGAVGDAVAVGVPGQRARDGEVDLGRRTAARRAEGGGRRSGFRLGVTGQTAGDQVERGVEVVVAGADVHDVVAVGVGADVAVLEGDVDGDGVLAAVDQLPERPVRLVEVGGLEVGRLDLADGPEPLTVDPHVGVVVTRAIVVGAEELADTGDVDDDLGLERGGLGRRQQRRWQSHRQQRRRHQPDERPPRRPTTVPSHVL